MAIQNTGPDPISAAGNALSYFWGQCTRWVAENLSWIPAGLGNANQWFGRAQAMGLPTGQTPVVGSVAAFNTGPFGHVAEVVSVQDATHFKVSEENWLGTGITDIRDVVGGAGSGLQGFIYKPGTAVSDIPVVGGAVGAAESVVSTGQAIANLPANIGHGLANASYATGHNIGTFAKNNIIPLLVALVVVIVLFGGKE